MILDSTFVWLHDTAFGTVVLHVAPEAAVGGPLAAVKNGDRITIEEVLTHYSGLPPDVDLRDPWGLAAPDKAEGLRRARVP